LLPAGHLGSCLLALNRSTCQTGTDAVAFRHLFRRSGPPANFGRSLGVPANERLGWHDCRVSQRSGLKAGITQTFDGEHPCSVCKAIQDGKKREQKKTPVLQTELKKDYLAPWNRFQLHQGWVEVKYPGSGEQRESVAFEPAVPPRSAKPLAVGF
jgi:hypothetical protein